MFNFIKKMFSKKNNHKAPTKDSNVNTKEKNLRDGAKQEKAKEPKVAVTVESVTAEKKEISVKYESISQVNEKPNVKCEEKSKIEEKPKSTLNDTKENVETKPKVIENNSSIVGSFVLNITLENTFVFYYNVSDDDTLGTSPTYKTKRSCLNGIESVKNNAVIAVVEDQTVENFEKKKNPKFEVFTNKQGEFQFRLKATNGNAIVTSKIFDSVSSCMEAIENFKKNVSTAETKIVRQK